VIGVCIYWKQLETKGIIKMKVHTWQVYAGNGASEEIIFVVRARNNQEAEIEAKLYIIDNCRSPFPEITKIKNVDHLYKY
jgi:hypothetical protein